MRTSRLWAAMPGCENTVIEGVDWHQEDTGDSAGERQLMVIVHVRPRRRLAGRCGICGRRRPGYDKGEGRRRRRALDPGTVRAELEAAAPRVAFGQPGQRPLPARFGRLWKQGRNVSQCRAGLAGARRPRP